MALVTVGNSRVGSPWYLRHSYYGVDYEYFSSNNFIHYKYIATERSYGKKIRIAYYSFRPTSNYFNLIRGVYQKELIPAVFRAENGVPVEVLSEWHLTFPCKDLVDGWQYYEVHLKRDFEVGEEIWAGVWSENLTPIGDSRNVAKGTCGFQTYYAFGKLGRKYDYAPYFDNGEIFRADYGADEVKGNASLYWQYYNEPISGDYTAIIGNPRMGNQWLTSYEIERERDDDYYTEEVDMEWWLEDGYLGYKFQLPTATYHNKMNIHLYHRLPAHKDYDNNVGYYEPIVIPIVFKCDSSGKLTELMNVSVSIIEKDWNYNGWIDAEIILKNNFNAGEYVFIGVYTSSLNPVWLPVSDSRGVIGDIVERYYQVNAYNETQNLVFIRDGAILNCEYRDYLDGYYSLYAEYCNVPPSRDYFVSVSSGGNVCAVVFRSVGLKTMLEDIKRITDSEERKLALFRLFSDVKRFQDASERKSASRRNLLTAGNFDDEVLRNSELKRNALETFRLRDFASRAIGLSAKLFTELDASDDVYRRLKAKRSESSLSGLSTRVNAGRLIFRVVGTVFGLWDWLKGKIRNENCVVELFTPITDVLELECRI